MTIKSNLSATFFLLSTQVKETDYNNPDGTFIRDYIDVIDLVDAHVKELVNVHPGEVRVYNVSTRKGM